MCLVNGVGGWGKQEAALTRHGNDDAWRWGDDMERTSIFFLVRSILTISEVAARLGVLHQCHHCGRPPSYTREARPSNTDHGNNYVDAQWYPSTGF